MILHRCSPRLKSILTTGVAALLLGQLSHAATINKANNTTNLNLTGSWTGGVVPGSGDIAQWTNTVNAANTTVLGASLQWAGIKIANPNGGVTINTGNTLTLGGSGIDMTTATQNFVLNPAVVLAANQSWTVQTGRTLTKAGTTDLGGFLLTFSGVGTKTITSVLSNGSVAVTAGTTTLSGANTFAGGVTLSGGTLQLDQGGSGSSSALGTGTLTITGGAVGSSVADVVLSTNNAQAWNGDFSFGGTQNLNLGTGGVTMSANRQISLGSTGDRLTVGGVISDSGSGFRLTTANSTAGVITGSLQLSGANTYSGGTTINGGLVRFASGALPATGVVTLNVGGALSVSGVHATIAGWLGEARLAAGAAGAFALVGNSAEAFNPSAAGSGDLSLGAELGVTAVYTGTTTPGANGYFVGGGGGSLVLANADTVSGANNLTVGNGGGGTVILAADQNLSGATTITAGTLQFGDAAGTGAVVGTTGIVNNGTLAFRRSDDFVFSTPLSGTGNLVQRGTGVVTLGVAATYVGGTAIQSGTLKVGLNNAIPTGSAVTIGASGSAANLDLDAFDQSISSLSIIANAAAANTVTIGVGKTLSVTGGGTAFNIGVFPVADAQTTSAVFAGGGSLAITNTGATVEIGRATTGENSPGAANSTTVDMTGLASFSANVTTFRVGFGTKNNANFALSNTSNSITATTLSIADSNNLNGAVVDVVLGAGTNVLRADSIVIGAGKGTSSRLAFASQAAGGSGSVVITNKAGTGAANITIGSKSVATAATPVATLDLRGHTANVTAGTVIIGQDNTNGSNTSSETAFLRFDGGTFTATSLQLGNKTGTNTTSVAATLEIGGGTFAVNTGGLFRIGNRTGSAGSVNATVNITGGTVTSNVDITTGGQANTTSTLTLEGGSLNLTGKAIGATGAPISNLNLRSGTLANVAEINGGAGLTKSAGAGANTLTLEGVNAYTGPTNVASGTLLVSGTITGSTAVNVSAGAVLGGNGGVIGTGATTVTVNGGGTLAPGAGLGILTVGTTPGNSVTFAGAEGQNAIFGVEVDPSSNASDRLVIQGDLNLSSSFDQLSLSMLGGGSAAFGDYVIASYTGTLTGTFDFVSNLPGNYTIDYGTGTNSVITLLVPEPGSAVMLLGGLVALLGGRRNRRAA
jgi:autotransporter-associated beta strand protein